MLCESAIEKLVECARRGSGPGVRPDAALETHLNGCEPCQDRWQAERSLTAHLRIMRIAAAGRRSPEERREALMRRFAAQRQPAPVRHWAWALAAAAVALLSVVAIPRGHSVRPPSAPIAAVAGIDSEGAGELKEEGFVAVPYTPPLAMGEMVSIVHADLYPAALANLGVNVDPAWTTRLPADLLVGEDGFPRAIRVSADYRNDQVF